ncbi:MAG: type III secretion chaperone [Chlamydiales bacterium]|nr:type III secretion chaperone [Chlamydiales bacterium]
MAIVNWRAILGWTDEQLEELRFSGFSFLREGHYKKALLFFEALVIIDPLSVYDTQTLGALYLQMGEGKKAVDTLDQALALDPLHEPTILNKVKALLTVKQKGEALALAKSLEKSEDPTIANDASALLAAYR